MGPRFEVHEATCPMECRYCGGEGALMSSRKDLVDGLNAVAEQIDRAEALLRLEMDRLWFERTPEENQKAFNEALAHWLDKPRRLTPTPPVS